MKIMTKMLAFMLIVSNYSAGLGQSQEVITGKVTDGVIPIVDARVMILADTVWTSTNQDGRFSLPVNRHRGDPVPVMVGKKGWFNGGWEIRKGERDVELTLNAIPKRDNPGYRWIDPEPAGGGMMGMMGGANNSACGTCHANDYDRWRQSTMASTTTNQWVLDQFESAGEAQGTCADCHAPAAAVHSPGKTNLERVASQGGVEAKGVSCDVCHKVQDVDVSLKPGVQAMEFNRQEGAPVRMGMMRMNSVFAYGPLADVVTDPMAASFNPDFSTSEFCSSCHLDGRELPAGKTWDYRSVYPEARSEEFDGGRVVPNQWTYQEWKNWQNGLEEGAPNKGQTCQDCHMNWTEDMLPYDEFIVEGRGHMMPRMMQDLGIRRDPSTLHPHTFEGATSERLENSAYVYLRPTLNENRLSTSITLTNTNTGHRLPTGVTFRHMLLIVQAADSTGTVLDLAEGPTIPEWGGTGAVDNGNYAGLPGIGYARITGDDQGNINVPFWEATKILSDNRLRPREQDANTFVFDVSDATGYVEITATLLYRKAFKPMANHYGWDTGDIVMEEQSEIIYR